MKVLLLFLIIVFSGCEIRESKGINPTVVTPLFIDSIAMSQTKDGTPILCIAYYDEVHCRTLSDKDLDKKEEQ